MTSKRKAGVTLVELLTVVAIVVLLTGILVPVLMQSRASAEQSSNTEKMRQLGLAWHLYAEEAGDYPPTPAALQSVANLPASVYSSNLDRDKEGIATRMCRAQPNIDAKDCLPMKRTFVMFTDAGGKWWYFKESVLNEANSGWLFDPSGLKMTGPIAATWTGTYRRLTFEGSVIIRHQSPASGISKSGLPYNVSHLGFLYCDPSKETQQKWLPQLP